MFERLPYRCDYCGPFAEDPLWIVTARQTRIEPEDGYNACPMCMSEYGWGENNQPTKAWVINRRKVKV